MRKKAYPCFLPLKQRAALSFIHHAQLAKPPPPSKSSTKRLPDVRLVLSRSFDHCLTLSMDAKADKNSYCLQSITLPLSSVILNSFKCARRVDIYFNSSEEVSLCFEKADTRDRYVVTASLPDVNYLLYGITSNSFCVYGIALHSTVQLDVYVRDTAILETGDLIQYSVNQSQFEKIFSFLTLQLWHESHQLEALRLPLFQQLSETQEEFISSIKAIYSAVQQRHNRDILSWNNPEIEQPVEVKIPLLRYQLDAIRWMVYRESNVKPPVDPHWIHRYFQKISDGNLYFSALSGHFTTSIPEIPTDTCLGGILADEMGLGKTLEIISLILLRPCTSHPLEQPLFDLETESDLREESAFTTNISAASVSSADAYEDSRTVAMQEESVFCVCGGVLLSPDSAMACTLCQRPWFQHQECVQFRPVVDLPASGGERRSVQLRYICPLCWNKLRVRSGATLIISPDHIWRQWQNEFVQHVDISRHKILIYEGLDAPLTRLTPKMTWSSPEKSGINGGFQDGSITEGGQLKSGFVQPAELATADIVLTTYSVIQKELGWASVSAEQRIGEGHRPTLRTAQRYLSPPSPLACVHWWRLCLDEAQMVESVSSKSARMLSEVRAVHRWCVTGTPSEKGLVDFYGLLAYLRVTPFSYRHYWNSMLYQPFIRTLRDYSKVLNDHVGETLLVQLLSRLLWRNTKALVGSQLKLSLIKEQIHWVDFTSVERYIHDRVLSECVDALHEMLSTETNCDLDSPLAALSGSVHWRLVALVTRARQACTHASLVVINSSNGLTRTNNPKTALGRGKCVGLGPSTDPTLQVSKNGKLQGTGCANMTDVIRRVIDDVHQECESSYRTWVFNKNGEAGCFILQEKYLQAASCYREVLRSAIKLEEKHGVLADWSQRFHAITNLHWLIQCCSVSLEDSALVRAPMTNPVVDTVTTQALPTWAQLDPRIDRDLVMKAKLLRLDYVKVHSRLLSKAREKLDPLVTQVERSLSAPEADLVAVTDQEPWLMWLDEAMETLNSAGILDQIPFMVEASLQGRSQFRTTLLHVRSGATFKSLLLSELQRTLEARRQLREAMVLLDQTWRTFQDSGEADPSILQKYYACCARNDQAEAESPMRSPLQPASSSSAKPSANRSSPRKRPRRLPAGSRCAYCKATEALAAYRQAINHEKTTSATARAKKRLEMERLLATEAQEEVLEGDEAALSGELTSVGLVNPFIVALQTVAAQVMTRREVVEKEKEVVDAGTGWVRRMAGKLERVIHLLFREQLCTGRVQMLTKEWWNVHDDTEQFMLRLQATSPTDLAFIKPQEIDVQLQQHAVDALGNWSTLQGRLSHLRFLRNALHEHTSSSSPTSSVGPSSPLECPTCLQRQGPTNPTFVLLPGCWHSLCLACHERIQSHAVASQRRCPMCRKTFVQDSHATRRRPLNLLHYDGDKKLDRNNSGCGIKFDSEGDDSDRIPIAGDHSSKVKCVMRCLKRLKSADPDAKAVVFSSWISVLNTIGRALDQNGICYATLFKARDGRNLSGFRCSGSRTWVLLIPIQLGANGLNLTEANHVLLVDPILSHGREMQAIARLHRIGQQRPCVVHRFLVRDSIETALHGISVAPVEEPQGNVAPTATSSSVIEEDEAGGVSGQSRAAACIRRPPSSNPSNAVGEDRDRLLQMTISQLLRLLEVKSVPRDSVEDGPSDGRF